MSPLSAAALKRLTIDPQTGRPSTEAAMKVWGVEYQAGWDIRA